MSTCSQIWEQYNCHNGADKVYSTIVFLSFLDLMSGVQVLLRDAYLGDT